MAPGTATTVPLNDIQLSDPAFWNADREHREAVFRTLRDTPGLRFFDEWVFPDSPFPQGPGYFALTRHEDVFAASRNPQLFCSGGGVNIGDLPVELNEFYGSMIAMDDPKHFRLRNLVAKGFTPKEVAKVERYVTDKAKGVVDRMLEANPSGECDFVEWIAAPLPLQIICEMMGIPESDIDQVFAWTNVILGAGDPEYGGTYENLMNVSLEIFAYAQAMGEDRRANPRDDLTSVLMAAEIDGDRLTPQEFGSFFILLVVAGNETTRNAISHGMRALTEHPDQRDALVRRLRGPHAHGRRGDRPLGVAGDPLPAHRDRRHRAVGPADRRRPEGRAVLQLGQPRRADVRRTRIGSTSPARSRRSKSGSAPAARTSASAPTWPAARSP